MKKKVISVILSIALMFSACSLCVFANEDVSDTGMQILYTAIDKTVNALVGGIASLLSTPRSWVSEKNYETPESFLNGSNDFIDEPFEGAKWRLGYSDASLLTGKELSGESDYYVGGSLSVSKKLATAQWDDQRVRTIAISDGRGISIFAVLDAYGMANTDVRAIREKFLAQYARNEKIVSINISALHQHSCVDTFGMNGDIVSALFTSSFKNIFGMDVPSGQNKEYMENLYNKTIDTMNNAIEDMCEGELYYGKVNVKEFIRDKRDPEVYDEYLHRFRFVPDDTAKCETWFVEGAIHCVGNGAAHTELTGDYPYYMQQYIKENYNANFAYIQGAELAISDTDNTRTDNYNGDVQAAVQPEWKSETAEIRAYGELLAQKLGSIKASDEKKLDPIFNIAYTECKVNIDNNILVLAAKGGLLVNNVVKSGLGKYKIVTEVGYAEFGKDVAVAIIPGELAPEVAFGGANDILNCWNGETWEYDSYSSKAQSDGKELIVFGLTNDQVGYLLPNNNWHSYFTENEEIVSAGKNAAAQITEAYFEIYNSVVK